MAVEPVQGPMGLLAGLVQGYMGQKDENMRMDIMSRKETRDSMLAYLGHMVQSPDVPAEHKEWAMQQIPLLAQHDITKKFPKGVGDLSTLPPVTLKQPPRQTVSQTPPMTLQPPVSGEVGRATNGTVNALGASELQPPVGPGNQYGPPALIGPNLAQAQGPVTIPGGLPSAIQNPQPPVQIAPGGAPHILTTGEKLQFARAAEDEEINRLQQQYPDKSREELAQYAQTGAFPRDEYTLTPGEKRFKNGQVVAENKEPKPGAKSGYAYERGPGGEPLVKDNVTGATLSKAEIESNPQAKAVFDTGEEAKQKEEERQDKRQKEMEKFRAEQQARAFANQETARVEADAINASKVARPMVGILDTQEQYYKSGKYTPRGDLALIVSAVRAMNPGTVRLPNTELELEIKAGSWGDRFRRLASTASTGLLPGDQRDDLMGVVRRETTTTATEAAKNWKQAFGGRKPVPEHLRRFGLQEPTGEPAATAPAPQGSDALQKFLDKHTKKAGD